MYKKLKSVVKEGTKAKKKARKEGKVKRIHISREIEHLVRQVFLKKRGISFRTDTGSCEQSPDSKCDLNPSWNVHSWFDAAKLALSFLKGEYDRASKQNNQKQNRDTNSDGGNQGANTVSSKSKSAKEGVQPRQQPAEPVQQPPRPSNCHKRWHEEAASEGTPAPPPKTPRPAEAVPEAHAVPAQDFSLAAFAPHRQPQFSCLLYPQTIVQLPGLPPLFDAVASAGQPIVAIKALSTLGAARLVEYILWCVHGGSDIHVPANYNAGQRLITEGLTGEDLHHCRSEEDLRGVINGPPARRQSIIDALGRLREQGGVPAQKLTEWARVPPTQPLPPDAPPAPCTPLGLGHPA